MNKPINFKDYFQWEKHQQGKVSAQFSKELLGNDVLTWLKEAKSFCEINFHHYSKVHPDNSEIQTFSWVKNGEKFLQWNADTLTMFNMNTVGIFLAKIKSWVVDTSSKDNSSSKSFEKCLKITFFMDSFNHSVSNSDFLLLPNFDFF